MCARFVSSVFFICPKTPFFHIYISKELINIKGVYIYPPK